MNAIGDGNDINIIRMRHHGADISFNKESKPYRPSTIGAQVERDHNLTLEFKDLYEVDNLIHALEKFKEACELHMGSWRRV
ncbi:MAG: hypothetical protein HDR09_12760 [Lachnospiraceae bacterium]|nr:hypothetical protein [Lachnospiraceae bacterium]